MIEGGYIIIGRKTVEEVLMDKSPCTVKLWLWLLHKSFWRDGTDLKRGQVLTTIEEMQQACSYRVGARYETPTASQIRTAYETLTNATLITTAKTTRGIIVTICGYDEIQNPASYETHAPKPTRKPREAKQEATGFDAFWGAYPRKTAKADAMKAWKTLAPSEELQAVIKSAVLRSCDSDSWLKDGGKFIPYPATYLRGRRWEDQELETNAPRPAWDTSFCR